MPEANGMILSKEEENDAEVRREDQDAINEFGRLNARLDEVKRQIESMKVRIIALLLIFCTIHQISLELYLVLNKIMCVLESINFIQKTMEKIDDASTELMMGSGDNVMLRLGGAMFETTEEEATEYCEAEIERQQEMIDKLVEEESGIIERQEALKKILYGRFGKSINLEA